MRLKAYRATFFVLLIALAGPGNASWLDGVGNFFSGIGDRVTGFFDDDETVENAEAAPAPQPAPAPPVRTYNRDANYQLSGDWTLTGAFDRKTLGSLNADGAYFSIKVSDPAMDMRTAYTQAPNGDFVCTVLDKQVIKLEGQFEHSDRINLTIKIKDIGKPQVKSYNLLATRER